MLLVESTLLCIRRSALLCIFDRSFCSRLGCSLELRALVVIVLVLIESAACGFLETAALLLEAAASVVIVAALAARSHRALLVSAGICNYSRASDRLTSGRYVRKRNNC